jgi:hypothetical protein
MASKDVWSKVHKVKNNHCLTLLRYPHVNYVGVSFKETAGKRTDTPTIQVAVTKKLPLAKLSDKDKIPSVLDGIPTDVVESDLHLVKLGDIPNQKPEVNEAMKASFTAENDPFTYRDTVTSGTSMAKYSQPMAYGTVGCFVTVTEGPKLDGITVDKNYLVTCQHVVEGASPSDRIIIPATKTQERPPQQNDRATYANGKDSPAPDNVDVAAIELNAGVAFKNEVLKAASAISFAGVLAGWPDPGTAVFKYGATTQYRDGAVEVTNVCYADRRYDGIMIINGEESGSRATVIADVGDSGSVFVTSDSYITGQLFAVGRNTKVSGGYTRAYAYPMNRQLSALAKSWRLT